MKADRILKNILLALLVMGTLNLAWQIYREVQAANARESHYKGYQIIACKLGPSKDESSRFLVELGLLLAFIGCCIRHPLSKLVSLAGLLFTTGVYVQWWRYYSWRMDVSEAGEGAVEHLYFLIGGTWLDLCLAASLPILVIWQAGALARPLLGRHKYS